jgi:hypothetical protein
VKARHVLNAGGLVDGSKSGFAIVGGDASAQCDRELSNSESKNERVKRKTIKRSKVLKSDSWKALRCLAAKDRAHAIDILKCLIQGGSKTHRPVGHKTRDVVVTDAADHAAWNILSEAAGGVCRKHGAWALSASCHRRLNST